MNRNRAVAGLSVLPVALAALAGAPAVGSDDTTSRSAAVAISRPGSMTTLLAGNGTRQTLVANSQAAAGIRQQAVAGGGATIRVDYNGFTLAARRSFQAAVNDWAPLLRSSVPINVKATFEPLGPSVLGAAGPGAAWRDFPGAPRAGTWYPDAVANRLARQNLSPAPDIVAQFSSQAPWYFGRDGDTPSGRYDFKTVVMHELGHGLGFLGAGQVSNGNGSVRMDGAPFSYDRFTENRSGQPLLGFPNNSAQLANQLTSGALFFDSRAVRDANAGARARLFAPAPWQGGSSYSHLDEGTYRQGNRNSLMTPVLKDGEAIHSPGPLTRAIFRSIGW